MKSWAVSYFLVGIGVFLDWDIFLVLSLLVYVLVLGGVSNLAYSVSHSFLSPSHRRRQMMMSEKDNNQKLRTLTNELMSVAKITTCKY